jgi:hypothetical protein
MMMMMMMMMVMIVTVTHTHTKTTFLLPTSRLHCGHIFVQSTKEELNLSKMLNTARLENIAFIFLCFVLDQFIRS